MSSIIGLFVALIIAVIAFVNWSIGLFAILGSVVQVLCFGGGIILVIVTLFSIRKDISVLAIVVYPVHIGLSIIYLRILYYFTSSLRYCVEAGDYSEITFSNFLFILNFFFCVAMAFIVSGVYFQISSIYTEE